jgi:hypothetical protein
MTGSEVDFFGTTKTYVEYIHSGINKPIRERSTNTLAAQPYVITNHNFLGLQESCIGPTYAVGNIFVELVRNPSTDVVGFETAEGIHFAIREVDHSL